MANLFNQDVPFNYKGILNLGGTINEPLYSSTLQYITDGMGNNTPILVSQGQVQINSSSGSSPFTVKQFL